jgi:hypothetical protein
VQLSLPNFTKSICKRSILNSNPSKLPSTAHETALQQKAEQINEGKVVLWDYTLQPGSFKGFVQVFPAV